MMLTRFVTLLLILAITVTSSAQQPTGVVLNKRAQAVKDKVDSLSIQDHISVIPLDREEQFGRYLSKDQAEFTFYDVDRKMNSTFKFTEVKKLKSGYGGYNFANHRHVYRTKSLVVTTVLVVGIFGTLLIALATAKD